MSSIQVAGLQFDIAWEDPLENFRRAATLAREAAEAGARLIVLPEMFATGFSMDAEGTSLYAEETRAFLESLACELGIWTLGGYVDNAAARESRPRNACSLFDPSGREELRYHKIHPFTLAGEHLHFEGGQELPSAEIEGVRVTALICYDLRFPEPFRAAALDTDLFVVIANWPDPRIDAWTTLLAARAIENQAYVLGVNRVGDVDDLSHGGCSALIDPMGRTLASNRGQEIALQGSVDSEEVREARERFSFLSDRRPEVYRHLDQGPTGS